MPVGGPDPSISTRSESWLHRILHTSYVSTHVRSPGRQGPRFAWILFSADSALFRTSKRTNSGSNCRSARRGSIATRHAAEAQFENPHSSRPGSLVYMDTLCSPDSGHPSAHETVRATRQTDPWGVFESNRATTTREPWEDRLSPGLAQPQEPTLVPSMNQNVTLTQPPPRLFQPSFRFFCRLLAVSHAGSPGCREQ